MAYTAEQVDEQIHDLEKKAEKQIATSNSPVKGRVAERDLLSSAEIARDLLLRAVKGEKETLDRIFGGDCERVGRLRVVFSRVTISEMHGSDHRWKHLQDVVDTIEAILRDLGSYKPWAPPALIAPSKVTYKGVRRRVSPGRRLVWKPDVTGEVERFEVDPALPAGLELSGTTGVITGVAPGGFTPETVYVVSAINASGKASVELVFTVAETPPTSLSYPSARAELVVGEKVQWDPEVGGGRPSSWSVRPELPAGLRLDAERGGVGGAPQEPAEDSAYEVIGENMGGKATATLQFNVRLAAPSHLAYPNHAPGSTLGLGVPACFVPEAGPGATFSVSPALPPGLELDAATGELRGTPAEAAAMASYEVSAKNAGGEAKALLEFEVKLLPPEPPVYRAAPELYIGKVARLEPEGAGFVSEWSVTPGLPEGLDFDPASGAIGGVPAATAERGVWKITAKNDAGEASTEVAFAVRVAPPSGLAFPSLGEELAVLRPVRFEPVVDGLSLEFTAAPALPPGLTLDAGSGAIAGSPTEPAAASSYEVVARNSTGSCSTTVNFAVKWMPPCEFSYPNAGALEFLVGDKVSLAAACQGGATRFAVEPPLPAGLRLDQVTGAMSGSAAAAAAKARYVVTASNEAGETSVDLSLEVRVPPPGELTYPMSAPSYAVGEEISLTPELMGCAIDSCSFTVDPPLLEGVTLDKRTGIISGAPMSVSGEVVTHFVTAENASGSTMYELHFQVLDVVNSEDIEKSIDKQFIESIEAVTDIADMLPQPSTAKSFGNWMVWMVHRAWLNDPDLVDFNFSNMHMPPPHIEDRIAPKLMEALKTNTHIEHLILTNSNLMKVQGPEMAEALRTNSTIKILSLESNSLDSAALREIAEAIRENRKSTIEQLRLAPQKGVGTAFGRPVEEAIGTLMDRNETIIKLGFETHDAHWRNIIDRALLRNNDFARRRRKTNTGSAEESVVAEERSLRRLVLLTPPGAPVSEVFSEEGPQRVFLGFVAKNQTVPTTSQLQSFAKSTGAPLKYSVVAPCIKESRSKLLDAATNTQVMLADTFEAQADGELRSWSEKTGSWEFDIWTADGKRYAYRSTSEPIFSVSEAWAKWLEGAADVA